MCQKLERISCIIVLGEGQSWLYNNRVKYIYILYIYVYRVYNNMVESFTVKTQQIQQLGY